jgi:flavodoxin
MKIGILYDSKYGNTKQVAEFLAEKMQASGHEVQLFRTKQTKPAELLAFQPDAILVGGPTHFGKPTRTLRKYIAKLEHIGQSATIHKAAVFNCHIGDDVCETIQSLISTALPQIKVFEKSLPVNRKLVDNWKEVVLPENWQKDASSFLSALLHFLS